MAKLNLNNAPNAQMLKSVQDKSTKSVNTKTVINIPLDKIDENPDNEKVFNMNEVELLAKNIKEEGFFGAIEVYEKEDGRYEISSGHRRYRAMRLLNEDTIPGIVSKMPEETKKRRALIYSNINIREMSPMDVARAVKYHFDTLMIESAKKRNIKFENIEELTEENKRYRSSENRLEILAEYFNTTPISIARYLKLNDLITELQKLIEDKVIPWTGIYKCADLDKDIQKLIYEGIMAQLKYNKKISTKQISDIIKTYAQKNTISGITTRSIDKTVYRIHEQLKGITENEIIINDKEDFKKKLSEIEDYIKILKKNL